MCLFVDKASQTSWDHPVQKSMQDHDEAAPFSARLESVAFLFRSR